MESLRIINLKKTYANGIRALDNVSLRIPKGIFGLLGPNGAGKSTLMRTISTLQDADEGEIYLGDLNVLKEKMEVRKILGYLPQEFGVFPRMTALSLLNHLAVLKGLTEKNERKERVEHLLHLVNLYQARDQKLGGFSGGMKRRFGIAQALLNSPQLLIVDEPTAGLDPVERHRFFDLLSEVGETVIVILSTHIVDDIRSLCQELAIMQKGRILAQGKTSDFIHDLNGKLYQKEINKEDLIQYKKRHQVISQRLLQGQTIINTFSDEPPGEDFYGKEPTLEDVYMFHTKNP